MEALFDLYLSLAAIAGVFVGFGALIILSSDSGNSKEEQHMVRAVVSLGLLTLVGALFPVGFGQYVQEAHILWGVSGGFFLGLIWFGLLNRTNRPVLQTMIKRDIKAALMWSQPTNRPFRMR